MNANFFTNTGLNYNSLSENHFLDNNPPEKPSNPIPENNTKDIDLNPTLSVSVFDKDNDNMNVRFYNGSNDALIGSVLNVENGSTVSVIWEDLSSNTVYFWYAIANDSEFDTRSDIWFFTTKINSPPDDPQDPFPDNGQIGVFLNLNLSVLVTDPDKETMDVAFFDASLNKLIGFDYNVESGTRASIKWTGLSFNTEYEWYVIVYDNILSTKSDTWTFRTGKNQNPNVEIIKPERGLYINNRKILPRIFRPSFIIGAITIQAEATDKDGVISKVEFFVNNKLEKIDDMPPYTYNFKGNLLRFVKFYMIKVVAYDDLGSRAIRQMLVKKIP